MKNKIHTLIITNLPSFYKINLYNEIAKRKRIFVIYTGDTAEERNADFFSGSVSFDYLFLSKHKFSRLFQLYRTLKQFDYKELILGGWDSMPLWLAAFCSSKRKNAVVVESSYLESRTDGLKGYIKRIFLSRISKIYASGAAQRKITDQLGFKGITVITKGVGVFNYIPQPAYVQRDKVRNFLYVGRFAPCKNLQFLISVFNQLSDVQLFIAGFGPLEAELKSIAGKNIHFLGAVKNQDLPSIYQKMDVFILPSKSEPWGLVVEEALNNGLPVVVSDRVGCAEEVVTSDNGLIFRWNDPQDLQRVIREIQDIDNYNRMRKNISELNFAEIETYQINAYL